MKRLIGFLLVLTTLLLASCEPKFDLPWLKAKAVAGTSLTTIGAFEAIRFEGVGILLLDNTAPVGKIEGHGNGVDNPLIASMDGTTLVLTSPDSTNVGDASYTLNPNEGLTQVDLKGLGSIQFVHPWSSKSLTLNLEGLGEIKADLDVTDLVIHLSGAGRVLVTGSAGSLDANSSGLGQVDAQGLVAHVVKVNSSGAGEVKVNATEKLEVNASGLGAVHYAGNPASKTLNNSGATSITPIE
jgi:hypothetical protein